MFITNNSLGTDVFHGKSLPCILPFGYLFVLSAVIWNELIYPYELDWYLPLVGQKICLYCD